MMAMFVEKNNSVLQLRAITSGVGTRLNDPATTTLLGPADTILGDAVGLGHPRRGG